MVFTDRDQLVTRYTTHCRLIKGVTATLRYLARWYGYGGFYKRIVDDLDRIENHLIAGLQLYCKAPENRKDAHGVKKYSTVPGPDYFDTSRVAVTAKQKKEKETS